MKKIAKTAFFHIILWENAVSAFFFNPFMKKIAEMAFFHIISWKNAVSAFFHFFYEKSR
jgi:hypothetical protein